jgi:hypothetical protein
MAGKGAAVRSGKELEREVMQIGRELGLEVRGQVRVGKRIWGAVRQIDVVLTDPATRNSLGLECKYQGSTGSAEEKIPTTIKDIEAWPIRGLVVFHGEGFSANMRAYLHATGLAVELDDLDMWLRLFFGLPF